jgi:hypothetical protein
MSLCRLLPLVLLSATLWARPVFVDNRAGDDARDGASPETAVRSLKRAVDLCGPGGTLHLAPGEPYRESLVLGSRGGTASAPIVVEGNGAVLSGLRPLPAGEWQDRGEGLYFLPNRVQAVAARPFLVRDGGMVPLRRSVAETGAGESCWDAEGVHFRAAPGTTIADYELAGTMLTSGLVLTGGSYIEVRDLVCEHFANDGFNIHGSCQGLVFRNIVGRWNGDDGFSIHEDVGATVLGGHFHHNNYGIQDINISRSSFYGVLVEDNRVAGADFMGGYHVLVDSVVRHNVGPQIHAYPDATRHMREPENPLAAGVLVLKNVLTVGGQQGLHLRGGRADVSGCTFAGAAEGIRLAAPAVAAVRESAVYGCGQAELVCLSPHARLVANAYFPGRMQWLERNFAPGEFAAYREVSGQDAESQAAPEPVFARKNSYRLQTPDLPLGDRQVRPGLSADPVFPFGEPVRNALAPADPPAVSVLEFDFEANNPWSRVYPSPEETKEGAKVVGTAQLSAERSHSGGRSVKLEVAFPAGRPGPWQVKLFSVRLPLERPVAEMRFRLFGDGSGLVFQPRLRDRSGECFYGPRGTLDWEGWREIVWNLRETPPVRIEVGDGNRQQDTPPFEVVLELFPEVPAGGGRLVLFADDLVLRLEE